jgi:hypothetical protein
MGEVIISGSSTSRSGGGGSSSDYTVIVTACVLLFIYMSYTGLIYCYFLLRFLTSMRQHRIVIQGNGVIVIIE